jgi:UDP-N-acetylmuramate dehydrogenase
MTGQTEKLEAGLAAVGEKCGCPCDRRVSLSRFTSFGVGGETPVMFCPEDPDTARDVYLRCRDEKLPLKILGGGTNLLVREGRLDFGVLNTRGLCGEIEVEGTTVRARCGTAMAAAAREAFRSGLSGLEFFGTLPGTVGGAVAVNAGWPEERMLDRVSSILYAGSEADEEGASSFILRVTLALEPGRTAEIRERTLAFLEMRRQKQPLDAKSAGCIFNNPPAAPAGRLIEEAGLKGLAMGGAAVSPVHANFIVNKGGATAAEILSLIDTVRRRVLEKSGVALEEEVIIW